MASRDPRLEVLLEKRAIKYLLFPSFVDKRGYIMCNTSFYSCVNVTKIMCNSSQTAVFVTYPSYPNLLNMHKNVLSALTKGYIFISHFSQRGIFSHPNILQKGLMFIPMNKHILPKWPPGKEICEYKENLFYYCSCIISNNWKICLNSFILYR